MRLEQGHDRGRHAWSQPRPQARLGRDGHRRQPRHPHVAGLCSSRRRRRAHDAAAGGGRSMESAGRRARRIQWCHHARAVQAIDPLRQGRCGGGESDTAGSEGHQAQGSEGLEDCRQAAQAARHGGQAQRQQGLCDRSQAAGHAMRRDQGLSGVRRDAQELRRVKARRHARREEGGEGKEYRRGRRRRYLVARQDRARCTSDRMGRGRQRLGVEREHRRAAQGGPDVGGHQWRAEERRRAQGDCRGGDEGGGGLRFAIPCARLYGGDECHRAAVARQGRGLGADAESRSIAGGAFGSVWRSARKMRGLPP